MLRRRRTDNLPPPELLPANPLLRARVAADSLVDAGFQAAVSLEVLDDVRQAVVCSIAGEGERVVDVAQGIAEEAALDGRAMQLVNPSDGTISLTWGFAAIPCGALREGQAVVVVADPRLTQREAQTIATWLAPAAATADDDQLGSGTRSFEPGGACGPLARQLATDFNADVVVISLFAQAGMLVNMHVRSGALLRSWRCPVDTVWGEAARHSAAFALGELHMHPGAECLSSIGMRSAAVVGLENGQGVAIGSIGVASRNDLPVDVAQQLLMLAVDLGPQIMSLRSSSEVPRADEQGAVELRSFARRVGCRRFALYSKRGSTVTLMAAHAEDGSRLVAPPDPFEEQLVCWAAERGIAVASDDAAAVMVGDDTVLYAQDPHKKPMECLRLALQDLRSDPYGQGRAA